jgi:ketosteroid isomerase-like protein
MSDVELVKKFYSLFKAGDKQGYLLLCDDTIEWNAMEGMPAGGRYVGKDSVFGGYFPKMLANFAEFHASAEEYLDAGDSIVVLGRYSGKSKAGKEFKAPFAHVYAVRDGRIASFRQYTDTAVIQQALSRG